MSPPARLLALRLQGFKSFAARTEVEFGPGISAIVGPNGAGKSNLADALRWTLGQQGRALRSRRSEDMIFAGSDGKAPLGMADVTVVLENGDSLLPVDYAVVELGRRLFRSGENEYLLNGTRVRLRDLEGLLDAARLADNAFLFIGQGMVDQALALRPEERRPLFEEVAGVRHHERRKRAAQERLVETEVNLARVRDVIAELRPQARRLAAQAEQQAARSTAADALAQAIVAAARERWRAADQKLRQASALRGGAQAEVDAALAELRSADDEALELTEQLARLAAARRAARDELAGAGAALESARVVDAGLGAAREALARDRSRLEAERNELARRAAEARRRLALPLPEAPVGAHDGDLIGSPADGSGAAPTAGHAPDARRALADEERALAAATAEEQASAAAHERAVATLEAAAQEAEAAAAETRSRRAEQAVLEGRRRAAAASLSSARLAVARLAERAAAVEERLRVAADAPLPRGARRLSAGLQVEERLLAAVEAALGAAGRGVVISSRHLPAAGGATLVLRDLHGHAATPEEGAATIAAAEASGGGRLADAVRADPSGVARRVLERTVWVPDRAAAMQLVPNLEAGWRTVTLAGDLFDGTGVVSPPPGPSVVALERQRDRIASELTAAEDEARRAEEASAALERDVGAAQGAASDAERSATSAQAALRARKEVETAAAQRHDVAAREAAWARSRLERLRERVAEPAHRGDRAAPAGDAGAQAAAARAYREATEERQRLAGSLAADSARAGSITEQLEALGAAEAAGDAEAERRVAVIAELAARVSEGEAHLAAVDAEEQALHEGLRQVERTGRGVRERLRAAEGRARAAEVDELEVRMALDLVREQLLVELAGLGSAGLLALDGPTPLREPGDVGDEHGSALERALDAVTPAWSSAAPEDPPPSPARLAALRRRYHGLGAVNPFATEEHARVSERLAALEAQRDDLGRAIAATTRLIADLERTIVEQFQETFRALGTAFDRRFDQLFEGGTARLALSDPEDPAASGVEIVARPPGKKAQPLNMLSGGERALTAVALLFAMLEVRPVPFCVLDEVDAALDEANIARFAVALRELAEGIQFIVITHNRGTIEQADALYGVTIGDDAVSRIVSLRLEGRATSASSSRPDEASGADGTALAVGRAS